MVVITQSFQLIIIRYIGFKYLQPPPLPSSLVHRHMLLDEIATKLLQATIDPNEYEITLTITGAGGFGKTTAIISLCHCPVVNKHFTDGFVFIELGPQATDPSIKLRDIYNLLTGEQCDINVVEQKINQLTSDYYHNLLVIIDDVWHVEDAESLVKAFSNCKTILTTRMNDIEQYIPSKQSVIIGPMTQHEAITLLTNGVIDSSQLSQEDVSLLYKLSEDVHLWPLLLSLIRGQLSHSLKQYHLSYHKAIQNVQAKLHYKGITAFDKNNIEAINKSCKLAVKACIEITLELLTKSFSDKIKILILWTGIGNSLQIAVLSNLWNISEQKAEETLDVLWAYGLVQFTDKIFPNNITQHCVEVHAVISQYIIECMDSKEVFTISPCFGNVTTIESVLKKGMSIFDQLYGFYDVSSGDDHLSLTVVDYLKYKLRACETLLLPNYLNLLNIHIISDPHYVILHLQYIKDFLMRSPYTINLLSLLDEEINLLIGQCKQILKYAHQRSRELNQRLQRYLFEQKYDELIPTVEEFVKKYPMFSIGQKAVTMVKKIIPYCDGEVLHFMMLRCDALQTMTYDYNMITEFILPHIKFYNKLHKEITNSLLKGSPDIELTYHYYMSGKCKEETTLVTTNWINKLQQIAPSCV